MLVNLTRKEINELLDAVYHRQRDLEEASYYGPISDHPHLRSAEAKLSQRLKRNADNKLRAR